MTCALDNGLDALGNGKTLLFSCIPETESHAAVFQGLGIDCDAIGRTDFIMLCIALTDTLGFVTADIETSSPQLFGDRLSLLFSPVGALQL
jgi:hypothetical protein